MVDVPAYVENEAAYIEGAHRRIAANARKTRVKKMQERLQSEPAFAALIRFVHAKAENGSKFFVQMVKAIDEYGAMSEKQETACWRILEQEKVRKAEIRQRDAGSEHVGTVGKRDTFTLTLTGFAVMESFYGDQYLHFMKDERDNVVMYKGTKKLPVAKGETIAVKATVKAHEERDGVKQTVLTRPTVEA